VLPEGKQAIERGAEYLEVKLHRPAHSAAARRSRRSSFA
jgi:hypothetical protein